MDESDHDPSGARAGGTTRQVLALVVLVALAGFALPVSAWVLGAISDRAENWIMVLQFVIVFAVAAAFTLRPSAQRSRGRALAVAFGAAVIAVLVANAVWLFGMAG